MIYSQQNSSTTTATRYEPLPPRDEQEKKDYLKRGDPIVFKLPIAASESSEAGRSDRRYRTIKAEWIKELVERRDNVVSTRIDIRNAVIEGELDLRHTTFKGELSITSSEFAAPVNLSYAVFEQAVVFNGTKFTKPSIFRAAHAEGDFEIICASFAPDTSFEDLCVDELFKADGAQFGSVKFSRVKFAKRAHFNPAINKGVLTPVRFTGEADFSDADIHGPIGFKGADFQSNVNFIRTHIGSATDFSCYSKDNVFLRTSFKGETIFAAARIEGTVLFLGACFEKKVTFERILITGNALFRHVEPGHKIVVVEFLDEVRFFRACINNNAEFDSAQFKGETSFERIEVGGNIYFRPSLCGHEDYCEHKLESVRFNHKANFMGGHIKGDAEFTACEFSGDAQFDSLQVDGNAFFDNRLGQIKTPPVQFKGQVSFLGARFNNQVDFHHACFGGEADFTLARTGGSAIFQGAEFKKKTVFREANFGSIIFGERMPMKESWTRRAVKFVQRLFTKPPQETVRGKQFLGRIDMGGLVYNHIGADLKALVDSFEENENRQPYTQLERVLRSRGDDDEADNIYLERRSRERKQQWRRFISDFKKLYIWRGVIGMTHYLFDLTWLIVGNYGVRPYRLLGYSLILLAVGALVFSCPNAVKLKDKSSEPESEATVTFSGSHTVGIKEKANQDQTKLSGTQALGVSLSQFVPIVEIPSGSKWKPSENLIWPSCPYISYAFYGTIHRLLGAILVPLGVASLTGLLQRREKYSR